MPPSFDADAMPNLQKFQYSRQCPLWVKSDVPPPTSAPFLVAIRAPIAAQIVRITAQKLVDKKNNYLLVDHIIHCLQ